MAYANYVMKLSDRTGRLSLSMAWWALFSGMFWLYIAVASASAVGVQDTLIGMGLSVITYGGINTVLSRYAARTGLTVHLFSRTLFGLLGSGLASLIFAATAIYYAVFEGSIIAVAFQSYFGGDMIMWYALVVLYAIPLAAGGVQNWLDKVNGYLLPVYIGGLVAVVVASTAIKGAPTNWIGEAATASVLPGWITAFLIYMGVWIMMMYTFDYARMGKEKDEKFHGRFTFGSFFYFFTFVVNGLVGIYIMSAWQLGATETGVVEAFVNSLGLFGVIVILVSQTRINSASYFLASNNLESLAGEFNVRVPRIVWVLFVAALAFLFMLTNVLSYLLKALAWQGVFVTAWVAIALVYIALHRNSASLPEVRRVGVRRFSGGALAWTTASVVGIALTEQTLLPLAAALAPVITVVLAGGLYYLSTKRETPPSISLEDGHEHFADALR